MSHGLTPREVESLELAADGHRSLDIARMWGYTKAKHGNDTGPSHVRRVWKNAEEKLGADTITQAVAMALRRGLIQ